MAEDPTLVTTLVNMIVAGCQMHSNVFQVMGKGTPEFDADSSGVTITLADGIYVVLVSYVGPPAVKTAPEPPPV